MKTSAIPVLCLSMMAAPVLRAYTIKHESVRIDSRSGVRLRASTHGRKSFVSGSSVPILVRFTNQGRLPFTFVQGVGCVGNVFTGRASYGFRHRPVALTRWGTEESGLLLVTHHGPPGQTIIVLPGKTSAYGRPFCLGRFCDLSLPGTYRLHIVTKYGVHICGAASVQSPVGPVKLGIHCFIPQDGEPLGAIFSKPTIVIFKGAMYHVAGSISVVIIPPILPGGKTVLQSNWFTIKILSPYEKPPNHVLIPTHKMSQANGALTGTSVGVALINPTDWAAGAVRIRTELWVARKDSRRLRLTGNPFEDFGRIQVTGPSYPGEYVVVKLPKPHDVPFIRKSPTLRTAYGHWLAKHPVRGLKEKTYTLKPGVVYKYAEPINLSCMYDMSLSGVYRVRVELAHTHVWSPWANVTVP